MEEKLPWPLPSKFAPPESFFVFVVGNSEEWPENREKQGDPAIYNEYLDVGVPVDQCHYIKDDDCTKENCQQTLQSFLERIHPKLTCPKKDGEGGNIPQTLFFYYGGHGLSQGFSTIGGTWTYRQVAQTIEGLFHGDRVLFFLDCCSSGNFWRYLPALTNNSTTVTDKQYALFATSQPYVASSDEGEEWISTNTWIQLMRRQRASATTDVGFDDCLKLDNIISLMADRHLDVGDLFFAYITETAQKQNNPGKICDAWSWIPGSCYQVRKYKQQLLSSLPTWLPLYESAISNGNLLCVNPLPKQAKMLYVRDCHVGNGIAYKHLGGYPQSLTMSQGSTSPDGGHAQQLSFYVPPLWLHGTIVSIFEKNEDGIKNAPNNIFLRIRVSYPSQSKSWEVEISSQSPQLINHYFVAQNWMLPKSFLDTQVVLVQKYQQYLDCSLSVNSSVRVALGPVSDDNNYNAVEGTVLDWKDFNWKRLLHLCGGTVPAQTGYDEYYWRELPKRIKKAALIMGYTKSSWDNDMAIPADTTKWDELTSTQKIAATVLKYVQPTQVASPDAELNGSDDFDKNKRTDCFWENLSKISTCPGPHVPVQWNHIDDCSFVPLKQIVFPKTKGRDAVPSNMIGNMAGGPTRSLMTNTYDNDKVNYFQEQCLLRGMESCGKSIGNAQSIFGTTKLTAFWPEDDEWFDAKPIGIVCQDENSTTNNKSSLNLLATHFEYMLLGVYCPVEYEDDIRHVIPLSYISRRDCETSQKEEGSSDCIGECDSETNTEESEETASIPTEEAIDKITKSLTDT